VLAIKTCAEACGIGRQAFDRDAKTARDGAARQLAQERRDQQAQERQRLQQGTPPTPPDVQILGLTPQSDLVLRTRLGLIEHVSPSTWCGGNTWVKWAPPSWMEDTHYVHAETNKPDYLACYTAWHAYAATLPVCILDNIRGLGVHYETSTRTIVWHTGRCLVVNPVDGPAYQADFAEYQGEHQYVAHHGPSNLAPGTQPLDDAQGQHLLQLLQTPGLWGGPNDGIILAGWAVLAALGELPAKRPHLVLTGDSSNGKSWVADNVLRPLLGGANACHTSSTCTVPGLRASVGSNDGATNTLPFLIDEQENKRQTDEAMEGLLRMAFDAGTHLMGAGGGAVGGRKQYVASALCTIGINQSTDTVANINRRLTVVRKTMPPDQWLPLQQALLDACTVATGQALVLRTVNHGHTIQQDYVPAFAAALAPHYTSTAGTRKLEAMALVVAHAYSLCTTAPVDAAGATAWLQQRGWDFAAFAADSDDQQQEGITLLRTVLAMQTTLHLYLPGVDNPYSQRKSVRWLVELAQHVGPATAGGGGSTEDRNGQLAREHLEHTWGLYLLGGKHDGHLLWATGPRGDTRQQRIATHETAGKWARGADAQKRLEALGYPHKAHKLPIPYGINKTARGVAVPLALLVEPDTSDAPCDPPLW
jgi:hypothetical protein